MTNSNDQQNPSVEDGGSVNNQPETTGALVNSEQSIGRNTNQSPKVEFTPGAFKHLKQITNPNSITADYKLEAAAVMDQAGNLITPILKVKSLIGNRDWEKAFYNYGIKNKNLQKKDRDKLSFEQMKAENDEILELETDLLARYVIVDWENVYNPDTGQPMQYSPEAGKEYLTYLAEDLHVHLIEFCKDRANFPVPDAIRTINIANVKEIAENFPKD